MGKIVAAGCTSHAPQLGKEITYSKVYAEQTKKIHDALYELSKRIKEVNPDALIIIAPDHLEAFFLDNFPMLNVVVDREAEAVIPSKGIMKFEVHYDLAKSILFGLVEEGFDPSFSQHLRLPHAFYIPLIYMFKDYSIPIVPIHVNANVEPKMPPWRCYELGKALARIISKKRPENERVAIVGTGGLSHYPGTPYYGKVDVKFDDYVLETLRAGRGEELAKLSPYQLEETGNIELRTWIVVTGAIGNVPAEVIERQVTYHIDYAVVYFLLNKK
jgi:aromatic ring-opening dioxygenase catalytic subunit (LigB family)